MTVSTDRGYEHWMGSDDVTGRGRKLISDVVKAGTLCLWGTIVFSICARCKSADELFAYMIIPESASGGGENSDMLSEASRWIQAWLFPAADYVSHETAGGAGYTEGLYPTLEDMEAFCEENSQYEALEAEAEQRLAAMGENAGGAGTGSINTDSAGAGGVNGDSVGANSVNADGGNVNSVDTGGANAGGVGTGVINQGSSGDSTAKNMGDEGTAQVMSQNPGGIVYPRASLMDYQFLINNFYVVDSSTYCDRSVLSPENLLDKDLTMDLSGDEPKILIYHTHSQESFADSVPGDEYGTVLGLGDTLTSVLQEKYGVAVYHERGIFDMIDGQLDRSEAYSMALPVVEKILAEHPSIKVVIDLHRDGVNEGTHLVTTVNGKPTAKIMFFNGLCRGATSGTKGFAQNPYLEDNLAFSLQMQLKAAEKYPEFTRRIYLRSYRFNMHVMPRTLLVECGAQTNTVEEVQNAMEPLADILYSVLSGQ